MGLSGCSGLSTHQWSTAIILLSEYPSSQLSGMESVSKGSTDTESGRFRYLCINESETLTE